MTKKERKEDLVQAILIESEREAPDGPYLEACLHGLYVLGETQAWKHMTLTVNEELFRRDLCLIAGYSRDQLQEELIGPLEAYQPEIEVWFRHTQKIHDQRFLV